MSYTGGAEAPERRKSPRVGGRVRKLETNKTVLNKLRQDVEP
jgi:hypothetical protein